MASTGVVKLVKLHCCVLPCRPLNGPRAVGDELWFAILVAAVILDLHSLLLKRCVPAGLVSLLSKHKQTNKTIMHQHIQWYTRARIAAANAWVIEQVVVWAMHGAVEPLQPVLRQLSVLCTL